MEEGSQQKTPNEVLADSIVQTLRQKSLIHEDDSSAISEAFNSGIANVSDWTRWIERVLDSNAGNEKP